MRTSALIPATLMDAANARLEFDLDGNPTGFGPNNFSVPISAGGDATHAGLSCGDVAGFLDRLLEMQASGDFAGLVIEYEGKPDQDVNDPIAADFGKMVAAQALQRYDGIPENLPMKGDERTYGGKTWESLVDFNGWQPPVAWRENVAVGYPEWVQPVGAVDAYRAGSIVMYQGEVWRFVRGDANGNNVWAPGVFGWVKVPQ